MISEKLVQIYKTNDIESIKRDLLNHYKYVGDLPDYEDFKQDIFQFRLFNKLKIEDIKELYRSIKPKIKNQKVRISAQDYDYLTRKRDSFQSEAIKKCIDKLREHKFHNSLTTYDKREGETSPLTEDIPNTYNISYYDGKYDGKEPVFYKLVSRETYRKLSKLNDSGFKLINHIRIDDTFKVLSGDFKDLMGPKNLHYKTIVQGEVFRQKLAELKDKTVRFPQKKHLIIFKNSTGKSITELVEKIKPAEQYIHKNFHSYTILIEKPKLFNKKTMESTDKKDDHTISLINEFEKYISEKYSFLNHINPLNNLNPIKRWEIENTVLARKRQIEHTHYKTDDENIVRILTLNGDVLKYEMDNYISFIRFFTRWIRKNELIANVQDVKLRDELKRLNPRGVKLDHLEKTEKAKPYIDQIYRDCFNSSILI